MTRRQPENTKCLRLTFVCTGNICRSPMAALVVTEHLRRAGLADRVRVTSAGTGPWHAGEPADQRASSVLAEHGYPTDHVAAQVDAEHLDADLVIALDSGHQRDLRRLADARTELRLLRSFDPTAGDDLDVPDPYYGDRQGFREVLTMVESAVPGLLRWVREHL